MEMLIDSAQVAVTLVAPRAGCGTKGRMWPFAVILSVSQSVPGPVLLF